VRIVAGMNSEEEDEDTGSELGQAVLRPLWDELEEEALARLDAISVEDLCRTARNAGIDSTARKSADFNI
jgi:Rrf2 family iron-sulfur cluster assembly transcriptional regulator